MDKKRILIGLTIAGILTLLMCVVPSGTWICLVVLLAIGGMATWEFFNLLSAGGMTASKKWGTAAGLAFLAATWFYMMGLKADSSWLHCAPDTVLWSVLLVAVVSILFRILAYRDMRNGLDNALGTLLGLMYVPFLWSFFIRVFLSGDLDKPAWAAFYILLSTKMADSGGYFIGTRFGKHRLAAVISPKKSWEGLFGSILFCLVVNVAWFKFSGGKLSGFDFRLVDALALGILIPLVGTAGDLVESMFKRAVNVKDSNTMVYGLGGILDMIDSILFTAPLLYIYMKFALVN